MKRIIIIMCLVLSFSIFLNAQTTQQQAKTEYELAESAFNTGNYTKCLKHLSKTEDLIGSTNSRLLYLEIKALYRDNQYQRILDKGLFTQFFDLVKDDSGAKFQEILKLSSEINFEIEKEIKRQQEIQAKELARKEEERKRKEEEERDYEIARSSGITEDKTSFLNKYPYSKHKSEVNKLLEKQLWEVAISNGNIHDYKMYIEQMPSGIHINEAKEVVLFDKIGKYFNNKDYSSTISYCNEYINEFPGGKNITEVKSIKQETYFKLGEKYRYSDKTKAKKYYNNCIDVNYNGSYYSLANDRLEEYRIAELKIDQENHYNKALEYKQIADDYKRKGRVYTGVNLGAIVVGTTLGIIAYAEGQKDILESNGGILFGGVFGAVGFLTFGIYRLSEPKGYFRNSRKYYGLYNQEMTKYNNIQVSIGPAYFPTQNNAIGLTMCIKL